MYLQYRNLKLIQISGRPDEDNKDILDGKYDNSEMPLSYEERMAKIFSDWRDSDILVIADSPLKHPKLQVDTLVEMTREEVCESGDLSVLNDGEVWEDNEIKVIPRPDGLKIEWIYPNWVETATDSEIYIDTLKKEYIEYKEIDTQSILREMELTDASIVDEYILMMIELRELISNYNMGISTISDIPTPSKALVDFKNRIKNIL